MSTILKIMVDQESHEWPPIKAAIDHTKILKAKRISNYFDLISSKDLQTHCMMGLLKANSNKIAAIDSKAKEAPGYSRDDQDFIDPVL